MKESLQANAIKSSQTQLHTKKDHKMQQHKKGTSKSHTKTSITSAMIFLTWKGKVTNFGKLGLKLKQIQHPKYNKEKMQHADRNIIIIIIKNDKGKKIIHTFVSRIKRVCCKSQVSPVNKLKLVIVNKIKESNGFSSGIKKEPQCE